MALCFVAKVKTSDYEGLERRLRCGADVKVGSFASPA